MSNCRLDIWDEAEEELLSAIEWYNGEREGLGDQLLFEVQQTLDRVEHSPLQYQEIYRDLRRAVVSRFPYSVIYRLKEDVIQVMAIMHQLRRPDRWQRRR